MCKSVNAVYVSGALYQPGEVCATIEVVDGIAQTDARMLAIKEKIYSGSPHTETPAEKLKKLSVPLG